MQESANDTGNFFRNLIQYTWRLKTLGNAIFLGEIAIIPTKNVMLTIVKHMVVYQLVFCQKLQ